MLPLRGNDWDIVKLGVGVCVCGGGWGVGGGLKHLQRTF